LIVPALTVPALIVLAAIVLASIVPALIVATLTVPALSFTFIRGLARPNCALLRPASDDQHPHKTESAKLHEAKIP
jgi:hypothetical protein